MFTSYFGNLKKIPANLTPIGIAQGVPRFFHGRSEKRLAPSWPMLKMSRENYDEAFEKILARLDPTEMLETLGEHAVLLCWEKAGEPWPCCHRRRVAEWLEAALGISVPELGYDRAVCPAYQDMPFNPPKEKARDNFFTNA